MLGTYNDNGLLQQLNDSLSFKYTENGSRFADNDSQLFSADYAAKLGVMQLLPSPYGEDRALLAVCAIDDDSMAQIESYLQEDENTWKLTDDAVLFDTDGEIRTYTLLKEEENRTPDLKQFVENNKDTVLFTVIAVAAMLLLLLAVILILVRIYLARRKEK